jgi:hypothetical protein
MKYVSGKTKYTFICAHDVSVSDFLEILDIYELNVINWIANGPSGGNPEITVRGTKANINAFKEYYR